MLSRVVRPKLLAAFVGVCLAGMIVSGYVFNWLQSLRVSARRPTGCKADHAQWKPKQATNDR